MCCCFNCTAAIFKRISLVNEEKMESSLEFVALPSIKLNQQFVGFDSIHPIPIGFLYEIG